MEENSSRGVPPGNPDAATLGDLIRRKRLSRGLTQEGLAKNICTRAYISQIETGSRFPAPFILKRLAQKLEVPLGSFSRAYMASPMAGLEQCLGLARIKAKQGRSKEARHTYEHAVTLHHRRGSPSRDAMAIQQTLGVLLLYEGQYEKGEAVLQKTMDRLLGGAGPNIATAEVFLALGISWVERGDLKRAGVMLQRAFNVVFAIGSYSPAHSTGVVELQYETVEWLMRVLALQRQYYTALSVYEWASSAWVLDGNQRDPPPAIIILKALADLGTGDPDGSEGTLLGLLHSGACAGKPRMAAAAHNNLAVTYRIKENWELARYHATMALDLWHPRSPGRHASANELGYASMALGDHEGARQALNIAQQNHGYDDPVPDRVWTAESLLIRAWLTLAEGEPNSARRHLLQAQDACDDVTWIETLVHIGLIKADLAEDLSKEQISESVAALHRSVSKWSI